jgi:aryl-alcohol dehydrogenase-like predicted oxidoreductase
MESGAERCRHCVGLGELAGSREFMATGTQTPLRLRFQAADLAVFPLCLGGNVFGWTADRRTSFAVLDRYVAAGGNFLDTADIYSAWAPGNSGGESESVIGEWLAARRNRPSIVIATKIGAAGGLRRENILERTDASLRRLKTDYIDLLYAHRDDPATDLRETVGALDELVRSGKVRYLGASNYSRDRFEQLLRTCEQQGTARPIAAQPSYNLVNRREYEDGLRGLVAAEKIDCLPYSGLASGFLTGKYRSAGAVVDTRRGRSEAEAYGDERGYAIVAELDRIACAHESTIPAVALAWLAAQPTVLTPLAGARNEDQLSEILAFTTLELSAEELHALSELSG